MNCATMQQIEMNVESLEREWSFLRIIDNPVLERAGTMDALQLARILGQYGQFPKQIVRIFSRALTGLDRAKHAGVVEEMVSNIQEELGIYGADQAAHSNMIAGPHYLVLRAEVKAWMGVDLNRQLPAAETTTFLSEIETLVSSDSPAIICGALLALEASAIGELRVVREIARRLEVTSGKVMSDELVRFFEYHANVIEVGHRDRLLKCVADCFVTQEDEDECMRGMTGVLSAMERWWSALATSASVGHAVHS